MSGHSIFSDLIPLVSHPSPQKCISPSNIMRHKSEPWWMFPLGKDTKLPWGMDGGGQKNITFPLGSSPLSNHSS